MGGTSEENNTIDTSKCNDWENIHGGFFFYSPALKGDDALVTTGSINFLVVGAHAKCAWNSYITILR